MRKLLASVMLAVLLVISAVSPAHAGLTAPRYGNHVTYYYCAGPYWSNTGWYYNCYADYTWYAEVFGGKRDGWKNVPAWYTA